MRTHLVFVFVFSSVLSFAACESDRPLAGSQPDLAVAPIDLARPADRTPVEDFAMPRPDLAQVRDLAQPPVDLPAGRDMASPILGEVGGGVWLIGWSGGLNHFSWIRFNAGGQAGIGSFDLLQPQGDPAWTAHYFCDGTGTWVANSRPLSFTLTLPAGCNMGTVILTFESITPSTGWPPGGDRIAAISEYNPASSTTRKLEGYRFPPSQCDPQLKTCRLPR